MTLHTVVEGVGKGLMEPLLDMQHLVFCLVLGLVLFVHRRRGRDLWIFALALLLGFGLERLHHVPAVPLNVMVALTVVLVLFYEWLYEKMAAFILPFLFISGLLHGLSLAQEVMGSATPSFVAYALAATLVQVLLSLGFGVISLRISLQSPDGFESLENVLSSVGAGVALAYFFRAF